MHVAEAQTAARYALADRRTIAACRLLCDTQSDDIRHLKFKSQMRDTP